jgi:hypothetical protein
MVTFTRLMLTVFTAFVCTRNPEIGQFAFNCALATTMSFEASRLLMPREFESVVCQFAYDHACSRTWFGAVDFAIHVLPLLVLLWHRGVWKRARHPWRLALASAAFHAGWAAALVGDYALDAAYLPDGIVADRAAWRALWAVAFASHFAYAAQGRQRGQVLTV